MKKYTVLALLISSLVTTHAMIESPIHQIRNAKDYETALTIYRNPDFTLLRQPFVKGSIIDLLSKKFKKTKEGVESDLNEGIEIPENKKAKAKL
jgi:hypothetical protein